MQPLIPFGHDRMLTLLLHSPSRSSLATQHTAQGCQGRRDRWHQDKADWRREERQDANRPCEQGAFIYSTDSFVFPHPSHHFAGPVFIPPSRSPCPLSSTYFLSIHILQEPRYYPTVDVPVKVKKTKAQKAPKFRPSLKPGEELLGDCVLSYCSLNVSAVW